MTGGMENGMPCVNLFAVLPALNDCELCFQINILSHDRPSLSLFITEQGDDVRIVVTLLGGGNPDPFQMSLGDVEIQDIAPGKNIWLELVGGHFLFMFDMPKTFGGDCHAMYYKEGGETWYCVASNDPAIHLGDNPGKSPFDA